MILHVDLLAHAAVWDVSIAVDHDLLMHDMAAHELEKFRVNGKHGAACVHAVEIKTDQIFISTVDAVSKFASGGKNLKIFWLIWGHAQKDVH